jgi:Cof subfamily protein (haloacid dehalogenase superfamily)
MIALDLDDTLLRSDLSISYRMKNSIKRAEAAGLVVVLASGRSPAAMDRFVRTLGMHKRPGYLICNNGSLILESKSGKVIYEARLPSEPALIAYRLADAEGFPVQLYDEDIMYISRSNEFADYDQKLTGLRQVVASNFRDMVAAGCYRLVIPGDPMLLGPLESLMRTYLGDSVTLVTSKPYYLEILPAVTDKGSALAMVAEKLGIAQGETLAIGDSMNDEAMLCWAGVGVAMVNGEKQLKAVADRVTERSNDEDGAAAIIDECTNNLRL